MPQKRAAKRYLRKSATNRARNIATSNEVKTAIKKFKKAIEAKNKDEAKGSMQIAYSKLDKAAKRSKIHPNKAARQKSRLAKALNRVKA